MAMKATARAALQIQRQLRKSGEDVALRLGFKAVGCTVPTHTFSLIDQFGLGDHSFESRGARIDFVTYGLMQRFKFDNHNFDCESVCGESLTVKKIPMLPTCKHFTADAYFQVRLFARKNTLSALLRTLVNQSYKHGFVTDIEFDAAPMGLSEQTIRMISANGNETSWLQMAESPCHNVHDPKICCKHTVEVGIVYFSMSEAVLEHRELENKYRGTVVPTRRCWVITTSTSRRWS